MAVAVTQRLADTGDRWEISIAGAVIDQCCFDYATIVRFADGSAVWELRIEQPFVVRSPDGAEHLVIPEEGAHLDCVLPLLRSVVESATAAKDGVLEVRTDTGSVVEIPPDEGFEAWTLTGPDGIRLVCLPGGELAVWS